MVGWCLIEQRVMDAVEDHLDSCAQVIVDIEVVESLPRPENLLCSTQGSNIFQLFDTSGKPNHFVASRRRWLGSQGRNGVRQETAQNEWYDFEYQGAMAKSSAVPRQRLTDSPASAKHVVSQRRRGPLGLDGR